MKANLIVVLVCAAVAMVGCGSLMKGKGATEASIKRFHQLYSDGKFDDIWEEAHPKFRMKAGGSRRPIVRPQP